MHALAAAALLSLSFSASASGQVAFGTRIGSGGGTASYMMGELNASVRLTPAVSVGGAFEVIGGIWACASSPREAIRCGYDGNSLSIGAGYVPYRAGRLRILTRASIGRFERTGTYGGDEYVGTTHFTAAVGGEAGLRIWRGIGVQAGLLHRQIFDGLYRDTFGPFPHFTAWTFGLTFGFPGTGW